MNSYTILFTASAPVSPEPYWSSCTFPDLSIATTNRTERLYNEFSIIDFNLFGKAKIFELKASSNVYESIKIRSNLSYIPQEFLNNEEFLNGNIPNSYDKKNTFIRNSLSFSYSDPHLLDSREYFFNTGLTYTHYRGDESYSKYDETLLNFEFGRRFARYSNISFLTHYSKLKSTFWGETCYEKKIVTVHYGWNSSDDLLFPSKGSQFSLDYTDRIDGSWLATLDLDYRYHYGLNDKTIMTFMLNSAARESQVFDRTSNDGSLFDPQNYNTTIETYSIINIKLTKKRLNNLDAGKFSGWYCQLGRSFASRHSARKPYRFGIGYAKQTTYMVVNFDLTYSLSKAHTL